MIENIPKTPPASLADLQSAYLSGPPTKDYAQGVLSKYAPTPAKPGAITPFSGGVTPATQVPTGNLGARYPYYSPYADNEELYAGDQGWLSKAGNGMLKGAGLALSTFANGTVGLLAGTMAAITDGKFSSFYDNEFSRALDDWNQRMENEFPNYYTHQETDAAWYSPKNLLTANFLFDKVIKNLGYSVGAIGAGLTYSAALRAIGLFSKVASAGGLARTAAVTEEMLSTVPQVQRASAVTGSISQVAKDFLGSYSTLNTTQRVIAAGLSTVGEASFEALHQLNDYRQGLINDYIRQHGQEPSGNDLAEINNISESAANTLFGLNVALLTATNYVQLPKIIGSSFRAEKNLYNSALRETGEIVYDKQLAKYLAKLPKTTAGKALYTAKHLAGIFFSPTEAFEELSQTSFNFGVNNYFNKARAGKDTDVLSDMLGAGYHQALTTKEGLESAIIGGISGGIAQVRHTIKNRGLTGFGGSEGANTKAAVTAFNQKVFSGYLKDTADSVNRGAVLQAERMEAIRRGDILEAKDRETDFTHNYVAPRIKYGRYDLVMDDIAQYRQLASTDAGLQQLKDQGTISADTTREQLLARLDNFQQHADHVNQQYQTFNIRYGGLKNSEGKPLYPDKVIDKMVYASAKVADYDVRIPALSNELINHNIAVQPILDSMMRQDRPAVAAVQEAVNQIDNLNVLSETKESLRTQLRDLTELSLRRKHFIKEYKDIKAHPEKYTDEDYQAPTLTPTGGLTIPQQDENGRPVYFPVEPGKAYPLSDPFLRDGNALHVFPQLQLHEENLLGELRHTTPTGQQGFALPQELTGYKLLNPLSEIERTVLSRSLESTLDNMLKEDAYKDKIIAAPGTSFEDKMRRINALDDQEMIDELEKRFKEQLQKLQQVREKLRKMATDAKTIDDIQAFFDQHSAEWGTVSTGDPDTDQTTISELQSSAAKKHIAALFKSSTSETTYLKGTGENDDFHRRANKFLNNLENIADPASIKVIMVTARNQDKLGLKGLIPATVPGTTTASTDTDEGIIRLAFVRSTTAGDFFVDVNGGNITKVGEQTDFNRLVYTTMPSTSLTWRNNEIRYINNGPNAATPEAAKLYQDSWRTKRAEILAATDTFQTYGFTVSRGFPEFSEKKTPLTVVDTLVTPAQLNAPVLVIPTLQSALHQDRPLGSIIHNEETVNMPLGRPVLQTATTLLPLNNRRLTAREKQVTGRLITLLAKKAAETGKIDKAITDYLRGLLFWKPPVEGKAVSRNQIWFSKGYLYLGSRTNRIPFIDELIAGSRELESFLSEVYLNANNFLLTQQAAVPFNEVIDIDANDLPVQVQWKSYQHFLLDNQYTTTADDTSGMQGTPRPAEEIPLTTDIVIADDTTDKYAATFQQKYITLLDFGFAPAKPAATTPQVTQAPAATATSSTVAPTPQQEQAAQPRPPAIEPVIEAGAYILDGKHLNTIHFDGRDLAKVAATFSATGVQFTDYQHLGDQPHPPELQGVVLQIATTLINKAIVEEMQRRQNLKSNVSPDPAVPPPAAPTEPAASTAPTPEQPPAAPPQNRPSAEDVFKNLGARRPPEDMTGGQYRVLSTTGRIIRENLTALADFHQKVLPQVPIHIVEQLIQRTDGGYAWGVLRDNAIYLYRHAEEGTGFHEIFEAVYRMFLSPREQDHIIGEFRSRTGSFTDRETGGTLTYAQASNHQAKEQIAEEFRDYILRKTPPPGGKLRSFFRRLWDFIRQLFSGRPQTIASLFDKIGAGYYSSMPVPTANRAAGDSYSTAIPKLSTQFIHDTMQGITAMVFEKIFADNSNIIKFDEGEISFTELYQEVFTRMENHFMKTLPESLLADIQDAGLSEEEATKAKEMYADFLAKSWIPIRNNWQGLIEINRDFLKPFRIIFENDQNQDELEAAINVPNKNDREYDRDILRISARRNASTAVKLLFATLTQVEQLGLSAVQGDTLIVPDRKLSSLKLPQLVNYAAAFNRLLYTVTGTNGLNNILAKIKDLATRDSTFIRLYNRLRAGAGYNNLSVDDWKLLLKLFTVASKQKPDYLIQITDEGGRTYTVSANDNLQAKQVISGWLNDLKAHAGPGKLVYIDQDRYRIDTSLLNRFDLRSVDGKISFISGIGIPFTRQQYDNLDKKARAKFNDGAQRLFNQLAKSADIATLTGRALGVNRALTLLAEAYVAATGETTESQHFNIEGEPVQNLILNNYVSFLLNDINTFATRDQLLEALPGLNDIFSSDSLLLEKGGILFDDEGNRRDEPLTISIMEGHKPVSNRPGISTAKMSMVSRRMLEFNQNLSAVYNILVPADAKTEWTLNLNKYHYIPFSDFSNPGALSNKVYRIFKNYLHTEMRLAGVYEDRKYIGAVANAGNDLRFFKEILTPPLLASARSHIASGQDPDAWTTAHEKDLREAIGGWIEKRVDDQFDFFSTYRRITEDGNGNYYFSGLDDDFRDDHKLDTAMTEKGIRDIIRFRTLNYAIHNIELHKVFFGDPAIYPDATKRIKSFLSGREATYHTDIAFDKTANQLLNRITTANGPVNLSSADPGYHLFRDFMPSVTVADIEVMGSLGMPGDIPEDIRKQYEKVNEADAQSWMRLAAYRELLYKAGGRWTDAMEAQYQYEHAYERIQREKKGTYTYSSEALKAADQALWAKGNPHAATFYVIKPIGSGVKYGATIMDMFLDKTSMMPMFYRLVEGTPMEQVYLQMQKQDIAYLIASSGRKIGAEQLHTLYNPDGTINQAGFGRPINVPFKYFGIQVETGSHAAGQPRGSQLTKLSTLDLVDNGVPIDVAYSYEEWNQLSEEQQSKASRIHRLVTKNKAILDALTEAGYRKILSTLGITEQDGAFQIPDRSKIAKLLQEEVERRELPKNLKDAITLDPQTGDFTIPLEALPNYKTLKNIIYAVVDRRMLSPLMPGGPKVQVSSTMFERNKRQGVYKPGGNPAVPWQTVTDYAALTEQEVKTVRLTSSDLKFYSRDQPYMEVYLPHWFKQRLTAESTPKTDQQLLDYLNEKDSDLLFGIGFRIPTQGPNSIERFRVKGFLPQEMGDMIIVPSEITVKAGSDFDIDKLNTYLKHYYMNAAGWPQLVTMGSYDTTSDQDLRVLYRDLGLHRKEQRSRIDQNAARLLSAIFDTDVQGAPAVESMEEFSAKNKGRDIYDLYSEYNLDALENEYISTLEELLTLPQNFERLIQPNSADELKALRNELNQALGKSTLETRGRFSLLLDPMYMSEVRHNFLSGKDGVGIAALQQTASALSQLTTLVLNPEGYKNKLTADQLAVVQSMQILLPHNSVTIGGQTFASLSGIKDTISAYISDKISGYINGFVDVAKDAFIIELGASLNVASTFMFLEKIGVPTRDVIFFMNQPIVRDFLKEMEIKGLTTPVSGATTKLIEEVKSLYPATQARNGPIDTKTLKTNIEKRTSGQKFTGVENAAQQQILDEFLKYTVFADHLFQLTQGYNYDTANFSESALVFRKQQLTERARTANLFSSVDKILQSSFIGKVADNLSQVKDAMGQIFKLDSPVIAAMLEQILLPYAGRHVAEDDFLVIATKLHASFLDYLTQVHGRGQLNASITPLLLSKDSVATQLTRLKEQLPKDSTIGQNIILPLLQPLYDDTRPSEPKNIRLTEKAYDAYTSNLYTDAMRELRDNVHTGPFFQKLLELSILQSGVRRSPISFTDILPVENYAPVLADVMRTLEQRQDLQFYAQTNAFQRVHWLDERIVPTLEPTEITSRLGSWYPMYAVPSRLFTNLGIENRGQYDFIQLQSHFQARELNYPVVKIRQIAINPSSKAPYTGQEQAEMRKNGDYSFLSYKLYQKVLAGDGTDPTQALSYPAEDRKRPWAVNVIYKQIAAWGKPGLVQEYYDTVRPSVLPSNIKVEEFSDAQIVAAFQQSSDNTFLQLSNGKVAVPTPSKASASTLEKVQKFLDRIGVDVQKVGQIVVNGQRLSANAAADITRRLIQITHGEIDTVLPEEAMHFAVEILQQTNPTLFNELLAGIGRYQLYARVLAQYKDSPLYQKDGRPDIIKIKKEAIARVLVETIIAKNEGSTEKPELLARTVTWWEKILDFLKGLFRIAGYNPFETAASAVLENKLATTTDAEATADDNVFLQAAPDTAQQTLVSRIMNVHNQLSKVTSTLNPSESHYELNGHQIKNRVTNLAKKYYNDKFRNKQISETDLQKAINDQKREKGVEGHSDLEDIFHRMVDGDGRLRSEELEQTLPSRLDPNNNSFYKALEMNLRQRLRSFKAGTRFFSEVMIYDPAKDEAGTIDFLAVEPDNADGTPGKIHILDWKFIDLHTNAKDVPWYKKEAWNIQLTEYQRILQTPGYGARKQDFGLSRAIPIRARYSYGKDNILKLYSIDIGGVDVKAISDDTILPVPTRTESTGSKELDNLISSLNSLVEKIYDTRSDPGKEYIKNERLNDLVAAIRHLHVKKETRRLFDFANREIRELNDFFKKYFALTEQNDQAALDSLDINDLSRRILDAEDVLSLYREFNRTFRKIFDPVADKPLLQEAEKISDIADIVRDKLLALAGALRSNPIARGAGIRDLLEPEKAVTWYQKWVRSLSQASTKATQILWHIVHAVNSKVAVAFSDQLDTLKKLESGVSAWVKAGGRTFRDVENLILAQDAKGRWNGRVISKVDPKFREALDTARLNKDEDWVKQNIDIAGYQAWYNQELADRKASYQTSRLHENDLQDAEIKKKRLDEFQMFYDIVQHPQTAITGANLRLGSYPNMAIWTSAAFKRLQEPGNEPVLALYTYWEQQLDQSHQLGMIKSWERKTFFPNVRKDFLDKMVFGAREKNLKRANLGFLDSIRIDVNDEVFGYTDINGNPQDQLSALYVYDLGERVTAEDGTEFTDYSNKSTDLFKVMALWAKEMAKFQHKSEVVDTVRLLYLTEQNRKAIGRSKRTGGISVRSDGSPVLIDNVENSQYFKNFADYYFYGKRMSEGQDVTFNFHYNNLAEKVNGFFGRQLLPKSAEAEITISGKKMIAATNRFFQLKTLGLNLATAVTNYMGGKANAYMLAGRHFTKADYTAASLQLAAANFHTEGGKVYAGLLNYFLPLTEDRTREQIRDLSVSKAVRLLSSDHLFYLMRNSDKWVQYPAAIAFFENTMVENGELVNIRQFVRQQNGYDSIYSMPAEAQKALRDKIEQQVAELKATRSLPKITKIENDKPVIPGIDRSSQTVFDLRGSIQQFSKDALGNMSEEDISQYRLTLLGQSFMMFKNWIPRMADVRFGEFRYQVGTDAYEWGRVSMLFNALRNGILTGAGAALGTLVGRKQSLVAIARMAYARKKAAIEATGEVFTLSEADFIDMYIKGVRTQLKEVLLMASMMALLMFARTQAPDDEDGRAKGAYKWLVRTIDKMTDELGFFYNPLSFTAIANGSVFPSVQILNEIVHLMRNTTLEGVYLVTGDDEARENNKVAKYLFKIFPITKELLMYTAIFNEDLAKEYGITINTNARRNY